MSEDYGRIKRNVSKMIDMGAPESDIDAYLAEEGVTAEQLRATRGAPAPALRPATTPGQPAPSGVKPHQDARSVFSRLFPGVKINDWKRDPNSPLGQANPGSWHNRSGGAVDIPAIPGLTFEQARQQLEDAGYPVIEALDEVNNPSGHATGPHWHFVIGENPNGDGIEGAVTDTSEATPTAVKPLPNGTGPAQPEEDDSFFRMPKSLDAFWESQKLGLGSVVEGIADIPGMVVDPINTLVFRGLGYDNYTSDLGGTIRKSLGLPEDNSITGDIIRGAAGGLTGAAAAKALARTATSKLAQTSLAELGSTPIRDTVAGASASGSARLAEEAGFGAVGQTVAGIAGGLAGYGGGTMVHNAKPEVRNTKFALREKSRNPYAAFDAEIAEDIYRATTDRAVTGGDPKGRAAVTAKTINNIEQGYTARFKMLIDQLEEDPIKRERLKEAIERKFSIPQGELDALRGTPQGNAVADSIIKVQRLRALTPELTRSGNLITKIGNSSDWFLPQKVTAAIKAIGRATGDGEAARVNAAERLLRRGEAYKKLAGMVGPSGQRESQQALWDAAEQAIKGKEAEDALAKMEQTAKRAEEKDFKNQLSAYTRDRRANLKAAAEMDPELNRREGRIKAADAFIKASQREANKFELVPDVATEQPITARDMKNFRAELSSGNIDPRDIQFPPAKTPAQIARRSKTLGSAISKMEGNLNSFDDRFNTPAPQPKAPKAAKSSNTDPAQASIDDAIAKGIQGESGTHNAFATRLGISQADMLRTLDAIEQDVPELASELQRIRFNYPTKNRKMGAVLIPRMRKAMEDLGIKPAEPEASPAAVTQVDEAAQSRLERTTDTPVASTPKVEQLQAQLDTIDPVQAVFADGTAERASQAGLLSPEDAAQAQKLRDAIAAAQAPAPADMRRINRPAQWQQSAARRKEMSYQALDDIVGKVSEPTRFLLGRMPKHLIENIKVGDDARAYVEDTVLPELLANGASTRDIQIVREGLYEIAQFKPHQTQEAYDAGTKANSRGRPRKNAE